MRTIKLLVLSAIAALGLMAFAGEPGNYRQPDYQQYRRHAPRYERSQEPVVYHRRHKKYYEEDEESYAPSRSYYCRGNCAPPPVLPYPGPQPMPVPMPGPMVGGVCYLYPIGGNFFDVVMNGQSVLYRGFAQNAAQMLLYYQSVGICIRN